MNKIFRTAFYVGLITLSQSANASNWFQDQEQYETYYDFVYHANIVEFFIHECTGQRSISYRFAFLIADIKRNYELDLLNFQSFTGPFIQLNSFQNLAIELRLIATRNPDATGGEGHPIHDAHREVLRVFQEFGDDRDVLCDFLFWDEVSQFQAAHDIFFEDTRIRFGDKAIFTEFEEKVQDSKNTISRLISANPIHITNR